MKNDKLLLIGMSLSLVSILLSAVAIVYAEDSPWFLTKDYDWDEFYDSDINRNTVCKYCDASEDYEKHEKACNKAYDLLDKQDKDTVENCKAGGGRWIEEDDYASCVTNNEDWRNEVEVYDEPYPQDYYSEEDDDQK